jgi:hypothetical protein
MVGSIVITIKSPSTRSVITSFALIGTDHNNIRLIPSELYDNFISIAPIVPLFIVIFGVIVLSGLIFKDKILFIYYYNIDKLNLFLRNSYICIYVVSLLINYYFLIGFDSNQYAYYYLSELDMNNIIYLDAGSSGPGEPGGFGGSDPGGFGGSDGSDPNKSGGSTNNASNERLRRIGNCEHHARIYINVGKFHRCDFVGERGIGHSAAYHNSFIAAQCVYCRAIFCESCDITRSGH